MHIQIDPSAQDIKHVRYIILINNAIFVLLIFLLVVDSENIIAYYNGNNTIFPNIVIFTLSAGFVFCIFIILVFLTLEKYILFFSVNRFWRQCKSRKPLPVIINVSFEWHNVDNFIVIKFVNKYWHYTPKIKFSIRTLAKYFSIGKDKIVTLKNPILKDIDIDMKNKKNENNDILIFNRLLKEQPTQMRDAIEIFLKYSNQRNE
jgi:hypothetical protein